MTLFATVVTLALFGFVGFALGKGQLTMRAVAGWAVLVALLLVIQMRTGLRAPWISAGAGVLLGLRLGLTRRMRNRPAPPRSPP